MPSPSPAAPSLMPRAERPRSRRDPVIDLVRNASLAVVVLLHTLMFGVTLTPDGPVFANAIEHETWFAPATWLVQVMPLFFLAGGFAALSSWRAMQARGETAADYVRARLERLVVPTAALTATVGVVLAVAGSQGLAAEHVAEASLRVAQPLWFLAVYVVATSLVPLLAAAHQRAPRRTLLLLAAGAAAVDLLRAITGADVVGVLNYAFVWLAIQQLGFWYLDGSLRRWSRWRAGWVAAGAFGVLAVMTASLGYPVDLLLANNNPATVALLVLGVAQLALLRLGHPLLVRLARRPRVMAGNAWASARAMTVYLWHMPVLVALTGILLATGLWMPEPGGLAWWMTRPVFLAVAIAACVPVVRLFQPFERGMAGRPVSGRHRTLRTALAVAAAAGAIVLLLVVGFGQIGGVVASLTLGLGALGLLRAIPSGAQHGVLASAHVANRGRGTRAPRSRVQPG